MNKLHPSAETPAVETSVSAAVVNGVAAISDIVRVDSSDVSASAGVSMQQGTTIPFQTVIMIDDDED